MLLTTTPTVEGRPIAAYHGIIAAETVFSGSFIRDFAAGVRDFLGGRSHSYDKALAAARQTAIDELAAKAAAAGADAVVGIHLDYQVLGNQNSMMLVSASGTAVTLGRPRPGV